jgi:hypothetical protein
VFCGTVFSSILNIFSKNKEAKEKDQSLIDADVVVVVVPGLLWYLSWVNRPCEWLWILKAKSGRGKYDKIRNY